MTRQADLKDTRTPCDSCGATAVRVIRRMADYTKGRTTVSYPEEVSICDNCGETFFTRAQMESRSKSITAALVEAEENPFTPERIKRILANLGMKPAQFERAVGLGNKTVARWERGTVPPSKAAMFTLWVAEMFPNVVKAHAAAIGEADVLKATRKVTYNGTNRIYCGVVLAQTLAQLLRNSCVRNAKCYTSATIHPPCCFGTGCEAAERRLLLFCEG